MSDLAAALPDSPRIPRLDPETLAALRYLAFVVAFFATGAAIMLTLLGEIAAPLGAVLG